MRRIEAEAAGRAANRALELAVAEGSDATAVVADGMVVMMLAGGIDTLVASNSVADVDTLHESDLSELLENAVHTRDPDRPALPP